MAVAVPRAGKEPERRSAGPPAGRGGVVASAAVRFRKACDDGHGRIPVRW